MTESNNGNAPTVKKGRPSVNEELMLQLLRQKKQGGEGLSTQYICRVLKCKSRTVRAYRLKFERAGLLNEKTDVEKLNKELRSFEEECENVMGISFLKFLESKTKTSYKTVFNFTERTWSEVWGRPSLFEMRDISKPFADNLAIAFINHYGKDNKTIRSNIKRINYFFKYFGRQDVHDRYLELTVSKHPIQIREVPQLAFPDAPLKVQKAIELMYERLGEEGGLLIKLKIATLMRTGSGEAKRELWGVQVKETDTSYLIMQDEDNYVFKIHAKMNEKWDIFWIPKEVRKELYRLYEKRESGAKLFQLNVDKVRKEWKRATKEVGLPALNLHDCRKIAITWLYVFGLPLEIATSINVGWKDLNTAKMYYLQFRSAIKKDMRAEYIRNLPAWFTEGLDQYLP